MSSIRYASDQSCGSSSITSSSIPIVYGRDEFHFAHAGTVATPIRLASTGASCSRCKRESCQGLVECARGAHEVAK